MESRDCRSFSIVTYADGVLTHRKDTVVVEHELAIHLNGQKFISLLCTPRSLPELVTGFLHAEGLAHAASDILHLCIDDKGLQADIRLLELPSCLNDRTRTVTSAGGHGGKTLEADVPCPECVVTCGAIPLDPLVICRLMETFGRRSDLFHRTGGVHSCALSDGSDILLFEDDIGRHNALDKIIGHTLLQSMDIDDKIILTSGRVSSEIVAKVSRRGIGAIISRSAPTSRAIDLARSVGMTLIGFARGQSLNVYANFSCFDEVL
ncbi:MAG: formate dehydrogenase accessory sulfurtransferase FdhD [Pedobacter sp.]